MEEWRDIKGYEQLYQVSNLGRIKSLERIDCRGRLVKERIMKPTVLNTGYLQICLSKDCEQNRYTIHRLVAEAFIPNPDRLTEVNHKDEDKSNNCVENLEFCDHSYNMNYGTGIQRRSKSLINHPSYSKTVYQYTLDGEFVAEYPSVSEAARQLDCDMGCICHCCNGRQKTAYGYKWSYKL